MYISSDFAKTVLQPLFYIIRLPSKLSIYYKEKVKERS